MIEADLRGIDSHGVGKMPRYEFHRNNGHLNMTPNVRVLRDLPAMALIDGDNGLGHVAGSKAMELAIEKCASNGVGMAVVRDSNHYGAAGVYSTMALERGFIGMSTTGTTQRSVVPTFAREPRYSTNPLALAAPAKRNKPFSLDMATSTVAIGKLSIARRAGQAIPVGWAMTPEGRSETDPEAALSSEPKRLSPLGGTRELGSHKGYGMAMLVDILASIMSGANIGSYDLKTGERGEQINVGHFFLAIDPARFRPAGEFEDDMDRLIDMLHATPPVDPDRPVLVAGDPEHDCHAERLANGIPLTDKLVEEVAQVAMNCGATFILRDEAS
jgi:LDH2 family malate/lactate/ureidoglycolate dehydrogenase